MQHSILDNRNLRKKQQSGFLTLISVLVVGAVGLSITTSVLLLSLGATRTSFTNIQTQQALALADACADRALQSLRADVNYAGSETFSLGQGDCDILAIGGTGISNRTVQATGTIGTILRKVKVEVATVASPMVITTWQEVADF